MSISELVGGLSELYYNHSVGKSDYASFVGKARQFVISSPLEFNVNTLYSELGEVSTAHMIQDYLQKENQRRGTEPLKPGEQRLAVTVNDAVKYVQDVLHYAEFFVKYGMLYQMPKSPEIKKILDSVLENAGSMDNAISYYNTILAESPRARAYMVGKRQPYDSILYRTAKPAKSREHENRYKPLGHKPKWRVPIVSFEEQAIPIEVAALK
jgi:hypothetical protein